MTDIGPDIHWGKGACGPVRAASGVTATCYDCGEALYSVSEHPRTRNGITHTVRAHFKHKTASACAGETWQHHAAKHRVATEKFSWYMSCAECDGSFSIKIDGTATQEKHWAPYYLDVAFTQDDRVTGAVEVCQTHESTECKCIDMTAANLAWIEVSALDVLNSSSRRVRGLRAAQSVCPVCEQAAEEARQKVPYERVRLEHLQREKQRLLKRKRDDDLERERERNAMRQVADEVQQTVQRLERCQSRDTGANCVALNTMRQKLLAARRSLDYAEELLRKVG